MARLLSLVLLFLFLPADDACARTTRESEWSQVLLEGRKIGHARTLRERSDERVVTTETLDLAIDRAGTVIRVRSEQQSTETAAGKPLAFRFSTTISGQSNVVHGEIGADGRLRVSHESAGSRREETMDWPTGALLPEGLRLLERSKGLEPGTEYDALAFQGDLLAAVSSRTRVVGPERISLFGRPETLLRIDNRMDLPGMPLEMRLWVDADYRVRKMRMPLLGLTLELLACDERAARAPNQAADVLGQVLLDAPRALSAEDLANGAVYHLLLPDDAPAGVLPDTGEQRVRAQSTGRVQVEVRAAGGFDDPSPAAAPGEDDLRATPWLQSDAAALVELARDGIAGAEAPLARMQALEAHVRAYIRRKNLSVGYASALETVKSRQGDCTEHALLLAALARAVGIPARVVTGFAYTTAFAGRAQVFVPHAWTQAWVDGRWRSFDAALAGFDAGHIAIGVGDGDPSGFYSGVGLLGRLRIERIDPMPARAVTGS